MHRGALVSLGYWNDPKRTAERFRPAPGRQAEIPCQELAVWSGDIVKTDEEGFLYYVGRRDDMIKTSGYRVSSTEIEEIIFSTGLVEEAVAIGIPHPTLGQGIVVVAKPKGGAPLAQDVLLAACRRDLPLYMVPALFVERARSAAQSQWQDRPAGAGSGSSVTVFSRKPRQATVQQNAPRVDPLGGVATIAFRLAGKA